MALTKISRGLLNTGVSDSSDATAITIDSSEKVGLNGLSAGDYWSTSNQLVFGNTASGANGGMTIATATDAVGQIYFADGTSGDSQYRGQIQYTHVSDAMDFATAGAFRMRIASDGDVGIGTDSPDVKLDVRGEVAVDYNATYGLRFYNQSRNNWSSIGNPQTSSNADLVFKTGGGQAMTILHNGRVMIGGSSPSDTFQVNGTVRLSHAYGTGTAMIVNNTNANNNYIPIGFHDNGTSAGYIYVNGSLDQTSYVTSSDYRLKENVNYSWNGLEKVKQLKPAEFNMISDEENTVLSGFLAHEVQSILPQAINGTKDAVDENGDPVYQGIDHSKLVPLLTKAVQELSTKLEAAEARITTLEG